jgi:hypothetical protein
MKSFNQFMTESINISGDFNGTLNVGTESQQREVGEEFSADIVFKGNIHRISMVTENGIPTKRQLGEYLQDEYPGAIVQNIYVSEEPGKSIKITQDKRYHPAKLDWV